MSQQEFADRIGYSRRQVIAWESAANAPPIWALAAVRREFDVDPEWILSGPGQVPLADVGYPDASRKARIRKDVEALAQEWGLDISSNAVDNLTALILDEEPGSEREAKRLLSTLFRAIVEDKG